MRTVTSIMGSTSSSQGPMPGATTQGGIPDPATQTGMSPASAVQPADPMPPVRLSQSFDPQLSSIPSSGNPSPMPSQRDPAPTPKSPLGPSRAPQVDIAKQSPSVDASTLSPQSFARSLWSDGPPSGQAGEGLQNGIMSNLTSSGSNVAVSQPNTAGYSNGPTSAARSGSGGSVDPPSVYSAGGQSPGQPAQRFTSPLSQTGPSAAARYTPSHDPSPVAGSSAAQPTPQPKALPPTTQTPRQEESWHTAQPGRANDLPSYGGPPAPLQMEKAQPQPPQAPDLSPQESYHSYPAGAEHQTPDLYEPQPRASRASHTVLQMVRSYLAVTEYHPSDAKGLLRIQTSQGARKQQYLPLPSPLCLMSQHMHPMPHLLRGKR